MSQGAYVTLVGFVAQEPNIRTTKNGKVVTDLRVGITPRFRDNATGEWHDGQTSYFSVSCWERLAHHVRASLHKGEPVLVKGRFRTDSYEDKAGQSRREVRITADTVGHDLTRGIANYIRQRPLHVHTEDDQTPVTPGLEGGPDEMIDEEAVERFGRDLEEADLAARALAESAGEGDGEDEDLAAEGALPPVPAAPF